MSGGGVVRPISDTDRSRFQMTGGVGHPPARADGARSRLPRWTRRFDGRSAAVLFTTAAALPLPILAVMDMDFLRPGGLIVAVVVWTFTLGVVITTVVLGSLGDRLFTVLGLLGMLFITAASAMVVDTAVSGVTMSILGVVPAIAAMSSSRTVVLTFAVVAIALGGVLTAIAPASGVGTAIRVVASVATVAVPVFVVSAVRASLEVSLHRYALLGDTDPLTGLLNRRGFLSRSSELLTTVATDGDQVGFMLIDVDHFKDVNDRLGHAAGDAVLVDTVRSIIGASPPGCLVGRLGGEEFVVLCATAGQAALSATAERVRRQVAAGGAVTISIGAVAAPLSSSRMGRTNISQVIDHLTRLADRWVYVAKSAGRDRVVCLASSPIHFVDGEAVTRDPKRRDHPTGSTQ